MRTNLEDFDLTAKEGDESPIGGSNFLISAILQMRRQKREMQREIAALHERVRVLENQNAAFIHLSAERLLKT